MKILLVCENIPGPKLGGLAKHVVMLGNALLEAGHDVSLMGRTAPSYAECAAEVGFKGRFIAGFAPTGKGWKERQMGIFNPWKRPYFAARIAAAIRAHGAGFDVVHYHGHHPMVGHYLPADFPFVQTRHDQGSECITHVRFRAGDVCTERSPQACATCAHPAPGPVQRAVSTLAVKRYRKLTASAFARHPVIFVSKFLETNFHRTMPLADLSKTRVVHAFIDESCMTGPSLACAETARQPVRVHVAGRLDDPKGVIELVTLLKPQLPSHWQVHVYGDGPRLAELMALCDERVIMHGHCPSSALVASLQAAQVAIVPSLLEEAFGMVTLEALRLGVPCYALARGGTPELARYGAPGQLQLFDNLEALVNQLCRSPLPAAERGGESADVRARLGELLKVYRALAPGAV